MAIEPGNVVVLKSGGQPMTVAAVEDNSVECLWLSDEGELFRETIPSVALSVVAGIEDEDDDLDVEDEDDEENEHEEADEDEDKPSKKKRGTA
jgi:uncharacterized protein YodC (DUF2158 family)